MTTTQTPNTATATNTSNAIYTLGTRPKANTIHIWNDMPNCYFGRTKFEAKSGTTWDVAPGETVTGNLCPHCFDHFSGMQVTEGSRKVWFPA